MRRPARRRIVFEPRQPVHRGKWKWFRRQFMKNGMRWVRPLPLLASVALAGASGICLAQNTNSGDLRGTALDPTGAIIPGVTVTVTDVDKGVTRTYVTDSAG